MNEWYCDHCGEYFPATTFHDKCSCGAQVNRHIGFAVMADGHHWTPPGAPACEVCSTPHA